MIAGRYYAASAALFVLVFLAVCFLQESVKGEELPLIMINEVMYDPLQNDNVNEWIELYNPTDQVINVSGWSITDNTAKDFLEGDNNHGNGTTLIPSHGYAIIADHDTRIYENFSIPALAIRLYVDDSQIGNGLGNSKDKLVLNNSADQGVDAMEWGYDYPDVSGLPVDLVDEEHSLARYPGVDTNNSSVDFYDESMPTPGDINKGIVVEPTLAIDTYPCYLSKIHHGTDYSLPFAMKVTIDSFLPNESYQVKACVFGELSSSSPATQTWNGTTWRYSNYYVFNITSDSYGNWSDWVYLRFNSDYTEYKNHIANGSVAYLVVKIKKDNLSYEASKEVALLDMDASTTNGISGGWSIGRAENNAVYLQNKLVIVENGQGNVTGVYVSENNEIDDNMPLVAGYYKVASPVGQGYVLKFLERDGSLIYSQSNMAISQGEYGVTIHSKETWYQLKNNESIDVSLTIENSGCFSDTINLSVASIPDGWQAIIGKDRIYLNSKELYDIPLHIVPNATESSGNSTVIINATSENDIGMVDAVTFQFERYAPDLTLTNLTCHTADGENGTSFGEGELITIKAFLKNRGNENATNVTVSWYYDVVDENHCIGEKYYESVSKYQKYPSIDWDTAGVSIGEHTIMVIVDEKNHIAELSETNNEQSLKILLYNTLCTLNSEHIVITELYYYAHSHVDNEFVTLYNSANATIDISGWYITNHPEKSGDDQTKIIFPTPTLMNPRSFLLVTQNATAFYYETGRFPDFEYATDADERVPQLRTHNTLLFGNNGGVAAVKDTYNHTIDLVVYGDFEYRGDDWNGTPINSSGRGVILKRNFAYDIPIDTDTCDDWYHPRIYGIGQSTFPPIRISYMGELTTFVSPDCSHETIVQEIRKARESLYLNIYEFTNPFLCDELVAALKRNVSVFLFAEGSPVGGIDEREIYILYHIASQRGSVRFLVNDPDKNRYARYSFDHAKYLIIDNSTVIVESCNWAKTGVPNDPTYGNREWGIVVRNTTVATYFLQVFLDDWNTKRCDSYAIDDMDLLLPSDFVMDTSIYKGPYIPRFVPQTFTGNFTVVPVLSPDTSEEMICDLITSANESISIEQLYIYKNWGDQISPFIERLVVKAQENVTIKILLNYNPDYDATNEEINRTKQYLEGWGIGVKFIYTNWSLFTNVHNKGMIIDNKSVLISSINWNENSVRKNREAGIIIENEDVARYYADAFLYDWELQTFQQQQLQGQSHKPMFWDEHKNSIYIVVIFVVVFALIVHDWRKRNWT